MVRFKGAERPFLRGPKAGLRVALIGIGALAAVLLLATVHAAAADKLVIFKNGKMLRVKGVEIDEQWARLDLGKGATIGVPTDHILGVEDSTGKGDNKASLPNQASVGGRGGGPASSVGGGRGRAFGGSRIGQAQQQEEFDESDEQEARKGPAVNRGRPTGGRRSPNVSGARAIQQQIQEQNRLGNNNARTNRFGRGTSRLSSRSAFRNDEAAQEPIDPDAPVDEGDQ